MPAQLCYETWWFFLQFGQGWLYRIRVGDGRLLICWRLMSVKCFDWPDWPRMDYHPDIDSFSDWSLSSRLINDVRQFCLDTKPWEHEPITCVWSGCLSLLFAKGHFLCSVKKRGRHWGGKSDCGVRQQGIVLYMTVHQAGVVWWTRATLLIDYGCLWETGNQKQTDCLIAAWDIMMCECMVVTVCVCVIGGYDAGKSW